MRPVKGLWCHELDLYICGKPVRLTIGEMQIFSALLAKPDWYLNREELNSARSPAAGAPQNYNPHAVEQYIRRIREKVRNATGYTAIISTEYSTGYRLNRNWYDLEFEKRQAGP